MLPPAGLGAQPCHGQGAGLAQGWLPLAPALWPSRAPGRDAAGRMLKWPRAPLRHLPHCRRGETWCVSNALAGRFPLVFLLCCLLLLLLLLFSGISVGISCVVIAAVKPLRLLCSRTGWDGAAGEPEPVPVPWHTRTQGSRVPGGGGEGGHSSAHTHACRAVCVGVSLGVALASVPKLMGLGRAQSAQGSAHHGGTFRGFGDLGASISCSDPMGASSCAPMQPG